MPVQNTNRPSSTGGQDQNSSDPQQRHYVTQRQRLRTCAAAAGPPPCAAEPAPTSASRVGRGPPDGARPQRALPQDRATPPTPGSTGGGTARASERRLPERPCTHHGLGRATPNAAQSRRCSRSRSRTTAAGAGQCPGPASHRFHQ